MCFVTKKKVNELQLERVMLEKRIKDLCDKLGLDETYKFVLVYFVYNIDGKNYLYDEWHNLHIDILYYNYCVLTVYKRINMTGLSLPKLFLV